MPGGRPSEYKVSMCEQAFNLSLLGYDDAQLAKSFEIDVTTLYRWKEKHTEFRHAITNAKDIADGKIAASLYQKATGYMLKDTTVGPNGRSTETIRQHPPDTAAMIFWLKNRQRGKWRDKVETEHSGTVEIQQIKRVVIDPKDPKDPKNE